MCVCVYVCVCVFTLIKKMEKYVTVEKTRNL